MLILTTDVNMLALFTYGTKAGVGIKGPTEHRHIPLVRHVGSSKTSSEQLGTSLRWEKRNSQTI